MKYILSLLAALIALSGCSAFSGNSITPTNAITVNGFDVDPQVLERDDIATFFLDIENVGGTTAHCVVSELYGVESWYDVMGSPLLYSRPWRNIGFDYTNDRVSFSYWDSGSGFVSFGYDRQPGMGLGAYIDYAWGQFTGGFCNSASGWTQFQDVKYIDSLKPAVPAQNKPGQSYTTQWQLRPPLLPEGVHQDYAVTARTSYLYQTNAHMNIQVYNKAEEQRREILGQSGEVPVVIEMSYASPIQIVATRGKSPIIVNQRASGYELVNYLFEFQNAGNGWPLPLGIQNWVKLRADRTAPFGCTIAIDRTAWVDNPLGTVSMTFNLWYRYYTDASTTTNVLGVQPNY